MKGGEILVVYSDNTKVTIKDVTGYGLSSNGTTFYCNCLITDKVYIPVNNVRYFGLKEYYREM